MEPSVREALWGWRVFEALARHTDPPIPLPERAELLALEEELADKPFSRPLPHTMAMRLKSRAS